MEESKGPSVGVFVAIFSKDGKVLLVKHSYKKNQWSLPGGGLESGEDAIAAGKREFEEETGLLCNISRESFVGTFFLRKSAGVVFLFVGTITGGEKSDSTNETLCAEFLPLDTLVDWDIYPAQRTLISRAFDWHQGNSPFFGHL
jgi:8-oxo-dGTP pyrophosphatase MutT (NUDIX family)